jgi:formate C-acetyltransferase
MHTFKPISERMQRMHQLIRDRVIQSDSETAMITTRCFQENENLIPYLRRPTVLKAICEQMTVRVEDFEMIVGNSSRNFCGTGYAPDWGGAGAIPSMIEAGIWTLRRW